MALASDEDMQVKWRYFLKTLGNAEIGFGEVMEGIRVFLLPVWEAVVSERGLLKHWYSNMVTWQ